MRNKVFKLPNFSSLTEEKFSPLFLKRGAIKGINDRGVKRGIGFQLHIVELNREMNININ